MGHCVLFHAFPNLQKFDDETKTKIVDSFIEQEVLKNQNWSSASTGLGAPITKDSVKSGMSQYAELNSSGRYRMKRASEQRPVQQTI